MLKISEFSRLAQVPTKTLRYYDEIGLLKPAQVDRFTGYRHYSVAQLPRLNRILALKGLGLTLDQIAQMLDDNLTPEQIRGMLRLKRLETLQHLEEEQARLAYVEARLKQIEQEGKLPEYEVVIKRVESIRVASLRGYAAGFDDISATSVRQFNAVMDAVQRHNAGVTGPGITLFHDAEFPEACIDMEAAMPTDGDTPGDGEVRIRTLPAVETMACMVLHGPYSALGQAYWAFGQWLDANGYHISGPNRLVYLQCAPDMDPANYVTEIQFPVEKT